MVPTSVHKLNFERINNLVNFIFNENEFVTDLNKKLILFFNTIKSKKN